MAMRRLRALPRAIPGVGRAAHDAVRTLLPQALRRPLVRSPSLSREAVPTLQEARRLVGAGRQLRARGRGGGTQCRARCSAAGRRQRRRRRRRLSRCGGWLAAAADARRAAFHQPVLHRDGPRVPGPPARQRVRAQAAQRVDEGGCGHPQQGAGDHRRHGLDEDRAGRAHACPQRPAPDRVADSRLPPVYDDKRGRAGRARRDALLQLDRAKREQGGCRRGSRHGITDLLLGRHASRSRRHEAAGPTFGSDESARLCHLRWLLERAIASNHRDATEPPRPGTRQA
mmetsp:Transcript_49659/g.165878  ORF Transcript_49659/g.165878 Transcript_49659/m.165878 type:complete len:285 (-) Transcript_49659:1969-2823(-)